ncbi:Rieske 2Fe-2S domain-containing protein, partial [Kitasatospora phosalacinea]|uniref:Rieske 2Fe-2S domain-containing protein n=1 Tax=Kitasatospora phosalacinea TaxID=2065 RepID=UPI003649F8D8
MLVVTFSVAGRQNCADIEGVPYVYATTEEGSFVMQASCPHRGGPLHLATMTPDRSRLLCPWHDRKSSVARLRQQIPAVRSGSSVTAVLPAPAGAAAVLSHRPISDDLSARPA